MAGTGEAGRVEGGGWEEFPPTFEEFAAARARALVGRRALAEIVRLEAAWRLEVREPASRARPPERR